MIADKADAIVIPVRIDGPERSHFGYLNRYQAKKVWFPKTTITILPPVRLKVADALRGKARRQAAGMALQDIMVDAAVKTANIDQTLFSALVEAKKTRDTGKAIVEDPLGTKLSYKRLITAAQVLGAKLEPLAPVGASVGIMLPNSAGVAVTFFAVQTIGRVPAMLNFTAGATNLLAACKAANVGVILTSRGVSCLTSLTPSERRTPGRFTRRWGCMIPSRNSRPWPASSTSMTSRPRSH
jgi:acyl-[acyl-carrier-protein]-phospholipid O-acyltransferase/long-chain-fatty-acid--[acyl-carrier-protein] ligase